MATRFRQMDPAWTVAALGVYGLMLAVSAWRWRLLLRLQTVDVEPEHADQVVSRRDLLQ